MSFKLMLWPIDNDTSTELSYCLGFIWPFDAVEAIMRRQCAALELPIWKHSRVRIFMLDFRKFKTRAYKFFAQATSNLIRWAAHRELQNEQNSPGILSGTRINSEKPKKLFKLCKKKHSVILSQYAQSLQFFRCSMSLSSQFEQLPISMYTAISCILWWTFWCILWGILYTSKCAGERCLMNCDSIQNTSDLQRPINLPKYLWFSYDCRLAVLLELKKS